MRLALLVAAMYVGGSFDDDGAPSIFDPPTNWARVAIVCTLIVGAVAVHIAHVVRGEG